MRKVPRRSACRGAEQRCRAEAQSGTREAFVQRRRAIWQGTEAFRVRMRADEAMRAECAVVDQLAGQVAAQAGVRVSGRSSPEGRAASRWRGWTTGLAACRGGSCPVAAPPARRASRGLCPCPSGSCPTAAPTESRDRSPLPARRRPRPAAAEPPRPAAVAQPPLPPQERAAPAQAAELPRPPPQTSLAALAPRVCSPHAATKGGKSSADFHFKT